MWRGAAMLHRIIIISTADEHLRAKGQLNIDWRFGFLGKTSQGCHHNLHACSSPVCAKMALMPGTLRYRIAFVATVISGISYLALRCWAVWHRWLDVAFSLLFETPLIAWIICKCCCIFAIHHCIVLHRLKLFQAFQGPLS
jgi:hypothetical protein